jgi:hypothetical protein
VIKAAARGASSGASAREKSRVHLSFPPFSSLPILRARDRRVRPSEVSVRSRCRILETTAGEDGSSTSERCKSMNKGPR